MAGRTRRIGNLPAEATSFIGRRRELAELRAKLTAGRLVSLGGNGAANALALLPEGQIAVAGSGQL